jgi:hypothetical protein
MIAPGRRGSIAPTHSRPLHYIGLSGQRHASAALYPGERIPGTHCTGGWVGPRAGLDTEAREKILSPLPGIEPRSPGRTARSQTLYCLSYPTHYSSFYLNKNIAPQFPKQYPVQNKREQLYQMKKRNNFCTAF